MSLDLSKNKPDGRTWQDNGWDRFKLNIFLKRNSLRRKLQLEYQQRKRKFVFHWAACSPLDFSASTTQPQLRPHVPLNPTITICGQIKQQLTSTKLSLSSISIVVINPWDTTQEYMQHHCGTLLAHGYSICGTELCIIQFGDVNFKTGLEEFLTVSLFSTEPPKPLPQQWHN